MQIQYRSYRLLFRLLLVVALLGGSVIAAGSVTAHHPLQTDGTNHADIAASSIDQHEPIQFKKSQPDTSIKLLSQATTVGVEATSAEFNITSSQVSETVSPGETVELQVTVRNELQQRATRRLTFEFGDSRASVELDVNAGESTQVTTPLVAPTDTSSVGYEITTPTDSVSGTVVIDETSTNDYVDVAPADLAGSGTAVDPYIITNLSELQAMEDDLTANYTLGRDIDASNSDQLNNGQGFDPVKNQYSAFSGSLDGNDHTISGLTINRSTESGVGLIGETSEEASITDISLRDITVNGSQGVGGLVGRNYGTIQNGTVTGTLNGYDPGPTSVGGLVGINFQAGHIEHAKTMGAVNGSSAIGGLAGTNNGVIQHSIAASSVRGGQFLGGLVGSHGLGTIRNVTASGAVNGIEAASIRGSSEIGGLIGVSNGPVRGATATGNVNGSDIVGGLIGKNIDSIQYTKATGTVTGKEYVGGLIGQNSAGTIEYSFAVGSTGGTDYVGGLVGQQSQSRGMVQNSYWDTQATGQSSSAGSATGLTTAQMIGEAARNNMTAFEFGSIWQTQSDDYPRLSSPPTKSDEESQNKATANVTIEDATLAPTTVNTSAVTHKLSVTVANVSADGNEDEIRIQLPDSVRIERTPTLRIPNSQYEIVDSETAQNPIVVTVNPSSSTETVAFTIEAELELSPAS